MEYGRPEAEARASSTCPPGTSTFRLHYAPRAGAPRTSLLPFQLWGIAKQNMLQAQAMARGPFGWLAAPNLAAAGMQGLMWDAAQRMERKKPLVVPQVPDAMKVAKAGAIIGWPGCSAVLELLQGYINRHGLLSKINEGDL